MIPPRPNPCVALLLQVLSLPVLSLPVLSLPAWAAPPTEPAAHPHSADVVAAEAALAPHAGASVRAVEVVWPEGALGVAGLDGPVVLPAATGLAALVAERQAAGHTGARVQASVRAVAQGVALRVELTDGPTARLGALRIEGNAQRKSSDLLAMLAAKVPELKTGAPVTAEAVDKATMQLIADYSEAGWVMAQVNKPEQTVLEPARGAAGPVVAVVWRVDEGPLNRVGAVRVALAEGQAGTTLGFAVPALPLQTGAPFNPSVVRAAATAVAQAARAAGFAEVDVSPSVRFVPDAAVVDVTLEVTPGPCCRATAPEPKPEPAAGTIPAAAGAADTLHLTVTGRRLDRLSAADEGLLESLMAAVPQRQPGVGPGAPLPAGDEPALLWIEVRSDAAPVATLEVVKTVLDAAGQPNGETRHRLLTTGAADADPQRCAEPQAGPRLAYGLWHDRDHTPNQPARYAVEATAAATCTSAGTRHTARAWTSPLGSGMTTAP